MATVNLELDTSELPITRALDIYHTWVRNLFGIDGQSEKLALASTVTGFDVHKNTPMFNEYSFRLWADRAVLKSPIKMDLPDFQARYSFNYDLVIKAISQTIENALTSEQKAEILTLRGQLKSARDELTAVQREIDADWAERVRQLGLQTGTPEYTIEQVAFYNTRQAGQTFADLSKDISEKLREINPIRYSGVSTAEARQILRFDQALTEDQFQMIRPRHAETEGKYNLDPVELGKIYLYQSNPAFEKKAEVYLSVAPAYLLNETGKGTCEIYTGQEARYDHKSEWSASGGFGGGLAFWSGSVDAGEADRRKSSVNKTREVNLSFENMVEILSVRGSWWSLGFYDNRLVREELQNQPSTTVSLRHVVTLLIVARGLSVTLLFSDVSSLRRGKHTVAAVGSALWDFDWVAVEVDRSIATRDPRIDYRLRLPMGQRRVVFWAFG